MKLTFALLSLGALAAVSSAQVQTPLSVTGFNQDLIAETGRVGDANTAVGVLNSTTTTTDDIYVFYQTGLQGSPTGTGLPSTGTIVSLAHASAPNLTTFQLASYAGNNALLLDGGGSNSGTLTLSTPAMLSNVSFLASGFNGSISTMYRLNYADGTSTTGTYTVQDNFNGLGYAIAPGRVSRNDSGNSTGIPGYQAGGNPRLYDNSFTADPTRMLVSVTFTNLNSALTSPIGRNRVGIFGISGTVAAVPEPTTLAALGLGAMAILRRRRKA